MQSGAFERSNVAEVSTFISEAFVHGGITSIMNNVSCFLWWTRLFTGVIRKHATTGVRFSTVVVFQNIHTTPHFAKLTSEQTKALTKMRE